jgi:hypothetical protein
MGVQKAQEEAKRIVERFLPYPYDETDFEGSSKRYEARQNALICVDEILNVDMCDTSEQLFNKHIEYYEQVKAEILKMK